MHTNSRSQWGIVALAVFILLTGMSCSLVNHGAGDEQSAPLMPTIEGTAQDDLPIPLVPDAANFSSSQSSFSYTTLLSVEEVAGFYQEKLPPLGWTIVEQGDMGGTLMWSIARQDVTYLLSIMPSNGITIVTAAPIK